MVLAEQRDLFGEFIYLHQILFEKIVNSCVILLSCLVLRQIAEPVAVVKVQPIQTADFSNSVAPCSEPVLLRSVGFRLKRLEVDVITVFNEPLCNALFGVFLTEPVQSDRAFITLAPNCPILPLGIGAEGVSHLGQMIFKLSKIVAHCNGFIQGGTGEVVACRHTGFVLLRQDAGRLIGFRVLYHGQSVLQADLIGNMAEVPPRFLFVLQSLAVPERNGVHNEVAVKMLRIQVSGHKDLKTVAPHSFCECHTDLLCKLRCDVGFLKAEITVIGLDAIRLVKLLFHRDELLTGSLRITVDALTEQLPFCFLSVLCIGNYITECLIIGVAVLGL